MGHQVTLAGFGAHGPTDSTIDVRILGPALRLHTTLGRRRLLAAWRYALAMLRLPLEGFDIVETASVPFAHLPILDFRCRRRKLPLVVTWHECWGPYWRRYLHGNPLWRLFALAEAFCARFGSRVIAPSRLAAERVSSLRREDVEVVPGGIDAREVSRAASVEERSCPVVYAGRLIPDKRVDLLVRAAAELKLAAPLPWVDIIGAGPDRPRLEALCADLGISERVRFRGALATTSEVWRTLGGAELAVQPSAREGFGLFPLEAMAAGLPVVHCASDESAVRELVRDGVEGLETRPEPVALAEAIVHLLTSPQEYARLAQNARHRASEFEWSVVARVLLATLASCVPRGAGLQSEVRGESRG